METLNLSNHNRITLTLTNQGWNATYSGPKGLKIADLFGTSTIPTAFTAQASAETVRREIERLNAGYIVEVQ